MAEFKWINEAPIYQVEKKEFTQLVSQFEANLEGWDLNDTSTKEARKWNKRLSDTRAVLKLNRDGSEYNFVYRFCGAPIGLMTLADGSTEMIVEELYTHPGSQGAGGVLLEYAVNLSAAKQFGGRLWLISFNKRSTRVYVAWGFVMEGQPERNGGGSMQLEPSGNAKWEYADRWVLTRHAQERQYLVESAD